MLSGKKTKVEFIESYIKHGAGDYEWSDNHGELVRCKDCKHRTKRVCDKIEFYECDHIGYQQTKCGVTDDWFCADGERKDGSD